MAKNNNNAFSITYTLKFEGASDFTYGKEHFTLEQVVDHTLLDTMFELSQYEGLKIAIDRKEKTPKATKTSKTISKTSPKKSIKSKKSK